MSEIKIVRRPVVSLDDYDSTQVYALDRICEKRNCGGGIKGLRGLLNELSRATSPSQVDQTIDDWEKGRSVRLVPPLILIPKDEY